MQCTDDIWWDADMRSDLYAVIRAASSVSPELLVGLEVQTNGCLVDHSRVNHINDITPKLGSHHSLLSHALDSICINLLAYCRF